MNEKAISEIATILTIWNPLGKRSKSIPDLDGYRTEAEDIFFAIGVLPSSDSVTEIVQDVLNQAFDLTLDKNACTDTANQIIKVLKKQSH